MGNAIAKIALVALLAVAPRAAADGEKSTDIRIKEEAVVTGPKVYLSDLVEVDEPELRERLATIEVSAAPVPGATRQLAASLVEARLEHAGVDLTRLEADRPAQIKATTLHADLTPESLAQSLREFIELEMPWDPEATEVDVITPKQGLKIPEGEVAIEWRASPQYTYVGPANFRGTIYVNGEAARTVVLRGTIETYQDIVVAATDIPRGRPISGVQLTTKTVPMSIAPDGAVTDPAEVEGLVLRRSLLPGQPVTTRIVESPQLIKRNQLVPVEFSSGTIQVKHQAKAMMDGREGDVIVCANPATKEQYQGVVRADGVVEVR